MLHQVIPENKRATREEYIKSANYYFTGLANNDGKGYYPFTDDCMRIENGIVKVDIASPRKRERFDPTQATRPSS